MSDGSRNVRSTDSAAWVVAIVLVSTTLAMILSWRAPGLSLYARDRLMQARGRISPPDDIVIVAIDEASIARYGRFPWPRSLTSHVIDTVASAQPKAIALDVLYSEPTTSTDDTTLGDAIKRAGNTVAAAQLIETTDEKGSGVVSWLRPLPLIENAAAGVGHVNVSTEADGAARELSLRKSDDQGQALWSIAVETIRVGEGIRATSVRDIHDGVVLGSRTIPVMDDGRAGSFASQGNSRTEISRPDRMMIDYVGPAGSFSHQTFSFADVLDGHVSAQSFRGKYVLIGATAATLGDHVASPFVHIEGARGEQHGELMPGVEVLASSMNTILRSRFYREGPDWLAGLLAAMVAVAVLGLLSIAQGRFETVKQLAVLFGLFALIIALSYVAFTRWMFVAPVVPGLLSFAVAAPLVLLRRSLSTSSDLDTRIAELATANNLPFLSTKDQARSDIQVSPATLIAQLTGANVVAIYARFESEEGFRLLMSHGRDPGPPQLTENAIETRDQSLMLRGEDGQPSGLLLIKDVQPSETSAESLRLCVEIASSVVNNLDDETQLFRSGRWNLPRGVEWKARALGTLNRRLLTRARFIDRALRAVEDGLIVSDLGGSIVFANPRAAEILNLRQRALVGSDLFQQLSDIHPRKGSVALDYASFARELLLRSILGRMPVERQLSIGNPPRYYMLRLSAVTSRDDDKSSVLGLVAALSDVTQQHELEKMRADVMTLVSHELLTPLTAIQGMSEVLAQFEVPDERRREMHLAINGEAKRLAHMIGEYLDIAKLESGRRALRLVPVATASLIQRVVLLLEPLAAQRNIRIARDLAPTLPVIMADADLLAQALTNLVANAIKYSPADTQIVIHARTAGNALLICVMDQGCGIPADVLPHVFEKFYRVPRVEDADVPGTGLGLTLVREIVELHGGHVTAESQLGAGSTFSVLLPLPLLHESSNMTESA
jgi:signal transduction histidine kinase/CHASE2 domain-containing sensor protein